MCIWNSWKLPKTRIKNLIRDVASTNMMQEGEDMSRDIGGSVAL